MVASTGRAQPTTGREGSPAGRLAGLDGIRGIAALFVVVHHCWLLSFPGYPDNTGPAWTGFLVFGHLAVVVFIVLSGFSLAVSPARNGWRTGNLRTFAHRRLWRILPPYWPALLFSLLVAWTVAPQPGQDRPNAGSVVIYGLLLQDVFGAPSPNGAFWSIAIEAQLYLVFPLLLLVVRSAGAVAMVAAVTAVVATVGLTAPQVPLVDLLMRFTPQFAALFALGVLAAGVLSPRGERWRARPLGLLSLGAALPVLAVITVQGPRWTVAHFFWVDLALGPAVALLLASLAAGKPTLVARALDTPPLRKLGSFSYSLYLTHAPVVVTLAATVATPRFGSGTDAFAVIVALGVPASVAFAYLFASVFETPFQRHRDRAALTAAVAARLAALRAAPYRWRRRAEPAVHEADS